MRIKSLYIKKYKILEDFLIDFESGTNVNVVIGKNGAGKTTLFEAIIYIFREISFASSEKTLWDRYDAIELQFDIKYNCKNSDIEFRALESKRKGPEIYFKVDGNKFQLSKANLSPPKGEEDDFTLRPIFSYLPDHIVTYYSGESKRVTSLFEKHKSIAYTKLQAGKDIPLRELINIDTTSISQVLLSLLQNIETAKEGEISQVLLEDEIVYGQIKFKQPWWYATAKKNYEKLAAINSEDALNQFNPEIYFAEGEVGQFVDDLTKFSQKEYEGEFIASLNFKAEDIGFMSSEQRLEIETSLDFFKMLDHTFQADLIEELTLQIHLKESGITIDLAGLSEGEHQIKLVLGLFEIFKEKETLFLFDEPDTYLHPEWQTLLMENFVKITSSQVFLTTHSTIALNRIGKEGNSQIYILDKGELLQLPQHIKSFGASPDAILRAFQRVEDKLPPNFKTKLQDAQKLINAGNFKEARSILTALKGIAGEDNREIVNLETLIEIKEL